MGTTVGGTPAKLRAFVVDLDRTLLRPNGRPTAAVKRALWTARGWGLRTILVSGRVYDQLRHFADEFGEFDAIVAENGAVVEAPVGRQAVLVGSRVASALRKRMVASSALDPEWGRIVVSVPISERSLILRETRGLPVELTQNVDRLMVLPRGITKSSGVKVALRGLRIPRAAYAAIGDAENDVDLLRSATLSGAVANARAPVRAVADYLCSRPFERGVVEFLDGPVRERMAGVPSPRRVSVAHRARGPRPR